MVRRLNALQSRGRGKYGQNGRRKANAPACNDVFSGGTQLNWPAKIGTQSRRRRATADTSCSLSRRLATIRKADASHIDVTIPVIGAAPSCNRSGRSAPADAGASNSAREPAHSISATGNCIPEVKTSSARDRRGPHRIFEFGELSRVRRDQPAAREEYGIVHRAQPAPDTGARRIQADQDHRLLQ